MELTLPPCGKEGDYTVHPPDLPPLNGQVKRCAVVCPLPCLLCFTFLISYATQLNISEGQVETAFVRRGPPVVSLEENNERSNFLLM